MLCNLLPEDLVLLIGEFSTQYRRQWAINNFKPCLVAIKYLNNLDIYYPHYRDLACCSAKVDFITTQLNDKHRLRGTQILMAKDSMIRQYQTFNRVENMRWQFNRVKCQVINGVATHSAEYWDSLPGLYRLFDHINIAHVAS